MKISNIFIITLIVGLTFGAATAQNQTTPASATPKTPRITKRQINQQARIKQGVKSGELTKGETRKLEKEQAKIQYDKKVAKSDGKVTPQERRKITREQNKASRDIKRLKNNKLEQK